MLPSPGLAGVPWREAHPIAVASGDEGEWYLHSKNTLWNASKHLFHFHQGIKYSTLLHLIPSSQLCKALRVGLLSWTDGGTSDGAGMHTHRIIVFLTSLLRTAPWVTLCTGLPHCRAASWQHLRKVRLDVSLCCVAVLRGSWSEVNGGMDGQQSLS